MLRRILEKPKHYRRRLAYALTAIIGVVIFSAWLFIASFNIRKTMSLYKDDVHKDKELLNLAYKFPSLKQSQTVITELERKNRLAGIPVEDRSKIDRSLDPNQNLKTQLATNSQSEDKDKQAQSDAKNSDADKQKMLTGKAYNGAENNSENKNNLDKEIDAALNGDKKEDLSALSKKTVWERFYIWLGF